MKRLLYIVSIVMLFSGCKLNLKDETVFPKVKNVTNLKKTDFVPTLESSFSRKDNRIYSATTPIAWNEIKQEIKTELTGFTSKELEELNNTKSYFNVLKRNEYKTFVEVDGNAIKAKAYFRKSLPFKEPLTKFDKPLKFGNSNVASFGFCGSSSYAKLNYFNTKNEFSVSLFPKNKEHEIILIMHSSRKKDNYSFKEYFSIYKKQKSLERNKNLYFNRDDKVKIPIIAFNLEKTFQQFIGSTFYAKTKEYEVAEAYQRNAFILNENGAKVESEAIFEVKEAVEEYEKSKPKMMIFNKPFVVLLKRKDAEHPYFGVYIANDELLKQIE